MEQGNKGAAGADNGANTEISTEAMDKAHVALMGHLEKLTPESTQLDAKALGELVASVKGYKTEFESVQSKKTERQKAAEEAAKNYKAPDYKTVTLPKDSFLTPEYLAEQQALAGEAKWDLDTLKTVVDRDHKLLEGYRSGVAASIKKYNDDAIKTLEKEWGDKFKENVGKSKAVTEFLEKQFPGTKAEIERLGLSNSVTTNKIFNFLFDTLGMKPDEFEFPNNNAGGGGNDPTKRSDAQKAQALLKQ